MFVGVLRGTESDCGKISSNARWYCCGMGAQVGFGGERLAGVGTSRTGGSGGRRASVKWNAWKRLGRVEMGRLVVLVVGKVAISLGCRRGRGFSQTSGGGGADGGFREAPETIPSLDVADVFWVGLPPFPSYVDLGITTGCPSVVKTHSPPSLPKKPSSPSNNKNRYCNVSPKKKLSILSVASPLSTSSNPAHPHLAQHLP